MRDDILFTKLHRVAEVIMVYEEETNIREQLTEDGLYTKKHGAKSEQTYDKSTKIDIAAGNNFKKQNQYMCICCFWQFTLHSKVVEYKKKITPVTQL